MSTTLKATKTRLALLQAVADGQVYGETCPPYDSYQRIDVGAHTRHRRVTARCEELRRAGWVEPDDANALRWSWLYRLTEAGRAVLKGAS